MKKVTFLLMISFILAFTNVRADKITITDTYYVRIKGTEKIYVTPVTLSAKITNLMDFPELVVVALPEDATMGDKIIGNEIIGNNSGIYKDGLDTSIMVDKKMFYYVVKKEYLEKVGLNNIDWQKDANVQRLNVVNNWRALYLSEKYTAITVEFKMVKKNNTYYVYKSKIVAKPWVRQAIADEVKTLIDNVVDPLAPIYVSEEWMF